MRLNICDRTFSDMKTDTYNVSVSNLQYAGVHMFIASNKWDSIHVDVDDSIPTKAVQYLPALTENITVTLPEKITMNTIGVLVSLFPKKSGALRRTFMTGGNIQEVLV